MRINGVQARIKTMKGRYFSKSFCNFQQPIDGHFAGFNSDSGCGLPQVA